MQSSLVTWFCAPPGWGLACLHGWNPVKGTKNKALSYLSSPCRESWLWSSSHTPVTSSLCNACWGTHLSLLPSFISPSLAFTLWALRLGAKNTGLMALLLPNPWLVHLERCCLPVDMAIGEIHSQGHLSQPDQLVQDQGAIRCRRGHHLIQSSSNSERPCAAHLHRGQRPHTVGP